eukprot:13181228-Alexandrium_andersonii.AAC.1
MPGFDSVRRLRGGKAMTGALEENALHGNALSNARRLIPALPWVEKVSNDDIERIVSGNEGGRTARRPRLL